MMRTCSKCGQNKKETEFNFKNKSSNKLQHQCKNCTRLSVKRHYENNKKYYLDKAKIRNSRLRKGVQNYIKQYLESHPCVDCGEKDPIVLEFDHRKEFRKEFSISTMMRNRVSIKALVGEISKCDVRCANCHRRKTSRQFGWYKDNASVA